MAGTPETLTEVLDEIEKVRKKKDEVSLEMILEAVGRRSFGPLLLVASLVILAPVIGDIPGVGTAVGIFVIVTAGQLAIGRKSFWLPDWLLERSVKSRKLAKPIRVLKKPAGWVDKLIRPRLQFLVGDVGSRVIAIVAVVAAATTPLTEVVPFSANAVGIVLLAFGLALIAGDGLMALIGMIATVGTVVMLGMFLM